MKYSNDLKDFSFIVKYLNRSDHEKFFVNMRQKLFSTLETIFGLYIDFGIAINILRHRCQRQFRQGRLPINNKSSETVTFLLTFQDKKILIENKAFK